MNFNLIGIGAALALSAVGSGIGAGVAGMAAIGAWKKCFALNKPAPFLLVAFVGAPLTQTIYGFILMNALKTASEKMNPGLLLGVGLFGGLAMGISAWFQGKAGACAADALAETGKGFGNYIMVLGLIETVALFIMVFMLGVIA
jgi:V/A-type H+-transporting ATPase subunit K